MKEFVHGCFKIYYSDLDAKMKLTFEMYDFDMDGYITQEDVRLVLSHIPIMNTASGKGVKEGKFTQEGGGNNVYIDRLQTQ